MSKYSSCDSEPAWSRYSRIPYYMYYAMYSYINMSSTCTIYSSYM